MDRDVFGRNLVYYLRYGLRSLKIFLLTKIPMTVLFLLIIIGVAIVGGYVTHKPSPNPTGFVTLSDALSEKKCPTCQCPEIIQKQEFNEKAPDCTPNNVIYYQCSSGLIVNNTDQCKIRPNITTDDYGYTNGFTLAVDGLSYELEDEQNEIYRIKWINYTLVNEGHQDIVPLIEVRVYDEWNSKVAAQYPQKVIETNDVLTKDEYTKSSVVSNILVKKLPKTVRLALKNKIDEKGETILAVTTLIDKR